MFPTAQHVVPSSHTTFLPAECHNLLVQYFILLLWLFSVRLCLVTFIFFFGGCLGREREQDCIPPNSFTCPAPWHWLLVVLGVNQQMKELSANLEGPSQAAGVHPKSCRSPWIPPPLWMQHLRNSTEWRQIPYSRLPQKFLLCLEMWVT